MNKIKITEWVLLGVVAGYLFGAFVAWDWNPGHWEAVGRALLTLFYTMMFGFGFGFGLIVNEGSQRQ